jgi:ribosomal protein S18 acetylase RimI-like enzyme
MTATSRDEANAEDAGAAPGAEVADGLGSPVLDNPVWASLTGHHASLAQVHGRAARFEPDVSIFAGVAGAGAADGRDWADLHALAGPSTVVLMSAPQVEAPTDWSLIDSRPGLQFVDTSVEAAPDAEATVLDARDVPEMLDLVARTQPGPFRPRTIELGTYLGIRREGQLVAMAGERLHPPGWVEISAVCTDPAHRGQGLGTRLIRAMAHVIRQRGERPFLHVAADNENAVRLYRSMGFSLRRRTTFTGLRTPAS